MRRYTSTSVIGSFCQAAHQTRRLARDVVKGPLDWVFVKRRGLLACIDTDFDRLGEWANIVVSADLQHVKDTVFDVDFYHAFRRDEQHQVRVYELAQQYDGFRQKLDALIGRYRKIEGCHLFVWTVDQWYLEGMPAREAAVQILSALRRRKPECDLLVVQSDAVVEPDWGGGFLNRYTPPTPGVWQGDDDAWKRIIGEVGLLRDDAA